MEPIASYDETRLEARRSFALYPDRIIVSGRSAAAEFETTIELSALSATVSRIRIRSRWFTWAAGTSAAFIALASADVAGLFGAPNRWIAGVIPPLLTGLIFTVITLPRIEYARFQNHGGIIILDIARSGRQRHEFDRFVELLVAQIQSAHAVQDQK